MILDRKFRACFITALLLISSLSIIFILPDNVKAESSLNTNLYFHDKDIYGEIEDVNVLSAIQDMLYEHINATQLEELFAELMVVDENKSEIDMIIDLLDLVLSSPRLLWFIPTIIGLNDSLIKTIDTQNPIKKNDSEHPAILNTDKIIEAYQNQDIEYILSLITTLAPYPGVYVYQGGEEVQLNGEIEFSLFFNTPITYYWNKDSVDVNIYIYENDGITEKYNATQTMDITRLQIGKLIENPGKYEFTFPINNVKLNPNDIIFVEIVRETGDKLLLQNIKDDLQVINLSEISETLEDLGEAFLSIQIPIPIIQEIGTELLNLSDSIQNISEEFDEENLVDLIYNITVELISSSFIYDSIIHNSHLSLPCVISTEVDDNFKTYYLHGDNTDLTFDEKEPTKADPLTINLKTETGEWNGTSIEMSKFLKGASLSLHLNYRDIMSISSLIRGEIKLYANIYAGDKIIASSVKELPRTSVLDLIETSNEPVVFEFDIETDEEISYDSSLSLEVFADNATKWGLGLYRDAKILFDSVGYKSLINFEFEDTDNIEMIVTGPKEIAAGDSAHFVLNISSEYDDIVTIDYIKKDMVGEWEIEHPEEVSVSAEGYTLVDVYVNSTEYSTKAYPDDEGHYIDLGWQVSGLTGRSRQDVVVTVSEDAIVYNVEFIAPAGLDIKRRESDTYHISFINKNTGYWPEDYFINATSSNGFSIELIYNESNLKNVEYDDVVEFDVKITIPKKTDAKSDVLTIFVITDDGNGEAFLLNITTNIPKQNILELSYDFFESVSESLGLDSLLGDYAVWFLVFMFLFLILIFIILAVYFALKKYIEVVCLDRIKEIPPDEQADYEIAIFNPSNRRLTYEAYVEIANPSNGWEVGLNTASVIVEPKQSYVIILSVKPTDMVKANDWIEAKVTVTAVEKQKVDSLSTVTTITDEKADLKITGVLHWPKVFKKGDRVTTSFRLENKGKVAANNVKIILYLNGKEKNKVEDITIPSSGYADIEIPWIAVKGKNDVDIVVE